MGKDVTLGGERLNSGKKMKVELHNYDRSTHNQSYIYRTTGSVGTVIPFMKAVGLPGTTMDIELDIDVKTHPTVGPLFGSMAVEAAIFMAPIRNYQGKLHNNALNIGMNMAQIKLPSFRLSGTDLREVEDRDNAQINPSAILSHLGVRGVGNTLGAAAHDQRIFNAVPWIAYWDIIKNYYANKQEENAAVIHNPTAAPVQTLDLITVDDQELSLAPAEDGLVATEGSIIGTTWTGAEPNWDTVMIKMTTGETIPLSMLATQLGAGGVGSQDWLWNYSTWGTRTLLHWRYITDSEAPNTPIGITMFPLENLDKLREEILSYANTFNQYDLGGFGLPPFSLILDAGQQEVLLSSQEGLALKCYKSDLFNNWIQNDWIDGENGINEITAISTVGDQFTVDQLQLAKKVYDMLNRIAVSGGSYDDYLDAVYMEERMQRAETPIYMGGLIKELAFQEVVSNSESTAAEGLQPLGTLAGKGVMTSKHKGGKIRVKCYEPCYVMGLISVTPRLDYSQGNDWDVNLMSIDDFHKPAMDQIGFQDLSTDQMAYWDTYWDDAENKWVQRSAGKQPAWINYMTEVNKVRGNFAIAANEMFMVMNRRWEYDEATDKIKDLTTYIDPRKFNHIFAQTSLDSQNLWIQIAVDNIVRRKMSAKQIPNL